MRDWRAVDWEAVAFVAAIAAVYGIIGWILWRRFF
jgi:hypothetical protein